MDLSCPGEASYECAVRTLAQMQYCTVLIIILTCASHLRAQTEPAYRNRARHRKWRGLGATTASYPITYSGCVHSQVNHIPSSPHNVFCGTTRCSCRKVQLYQAIDRSCPRNTRPRMIALRGARFACAQMQECTYPAMQYSCSIHVARTQQPSMTTLCSRGCTHGPCGVGRVGWAVSAGGVCGASTGATAKHRTGGSGTVPASAQR
jgi:hypothetical protein